jgi:hypothetical protein
MLLEGNTGDSSEIFAAMRIRPHHFDQENLAYLK